MDGWHSDEMATSLAIYSLQQQQQLPPAAPAVSAAAAPAVSGEEESKTEKKEKKEKKTKEAKAKKEAKVAAAKETDDKPKKAKKEKAPEVKYVDETPAGMKKILTAEFPATYQPAYVESAWQSWWEKSGFYQPDLAKAKAAKEDMKFVMVIPPPNVTGSLHLGHALTSTIEDTLTRWYRMKGYVALWVPGVDHAGIATQSVVEKRLQKVASSQLLSPTSSPPLSASPRLPDGGHHQT
jgi:valyl-tRNA synthetase